MGAPSPFTGEQVWGRVVHGPSHCSCLQTLKEMSGPKWTKVVAGPSDFWEEQPCDAGLRGDLGLGPPARGTQGHPPAQPKASSRCSSVLPPPFLLSVHNPKGVFLFVSLIYQLGKWEHGVPGLVNIGQNVA